jgi:sugar O-acyltransferase (sialic acid O-acetyltransferase NeuD family)
MLFRENQWINQHQKIKKSMLIIGAGGHAKELVGIFYERNLISNLYCYDDVNKHDDNLLLGISPILKNEEEAKRLFRTDAAFVLGLGNPKLRELLAQKFLRLGGKLTSVISPDARVGRLNVFLGEGINIMAGAVVTQNISIGVGTLVNANATIHHDCRIGDYCELSPGCHLLGNVRMGARTFVGAGAVILPNNVIGSDVVIGAGAVVTKDIPNGMMVKGVPAKS